MKIEGRNFINFDLQTRRLSFNKANNLRSISVASSEGFFKKVRKSKSLPKLHKTNSVDYNNKDNLMEQYYKDKKEERNSFDFQCEADSNISKLNKQIKNNNKNIVNYSNISADNIEIRSTKYGSMIKANLNNTFLTNINSYNNNTKQKDHEEKKKISKQNLNKIAALDFSKLVSRENFYKIHEKKSEVYGYIIPNINSVFPSNNLNINEEPVCKLNYNVKTHKNRNAEIISKNVFPLDPYEHLDRINNYSKASVIDMKKISSRPDSNSDDALPCYMKVIF